MLQVARLAPRVLGKATESIAAFLKSQQNSDGGFRDKSTNKSTNSDLYYTLFGIDASLALQIELDKERIRCYLHKFGNGEALDFVHFCSLIRCRSAMGFEKSQAKIFSNRLAQFRAADGGFHPKPNSSESTAYANFLGYSAAQDLGETIPNLRGLIRSFKHLETQNSWANERRIKVGSTTATAAAVCVLRDLQMPIGEAVGHWLSDRLHPMGGFLAAPQSPIPDLLSTATALHALAAMEVSFEPFKEKCLDFIDTLWTNEGAFYGHWQEETLDCEYTFYALLALGHLSVG